MSTLSSQRVLRKRNFIKVDSFLPRLGCFCFELRSCVAVFAWCFATASFGCVILSIIFSARAYELDQDKLKHVDIDSKKRELWVLTVSLFIYGLVSLPLAVLMLQGALQGRRTLMVPWLCGAGIGISVVVTILIFMRQVLKWEVTVSISVALGILIYAWIHVFSLFYRSRPRSGTVRFSSRPFSDNADVVKLPETAKISVHPRPRPPTWPPPDRRVLVKKEQRDCHSLRSQHRIHTNTSRNVVRGLFVEPLPRRNLNTNFEKRKPVFL